MRLNAYILAADPAWIEASVLSYYDVVDRIVVSYDEGSVSWTGTRIDVEQCLRRLRAIDKASKFDYRPGHFARREFFGRPMENDTHQRQVALEQASEGADWILQLDTDEVLADPSIFRSAITRAEGNNRSALNFPAMWLYAPIRGRWYLEWCVRGFVRSGSYPGPLAVKVGSRLTHARRVASGHYHVDIRKPGSRGRVPNEIVPNEIIRPDQAAWHFSMVRSAETLERKFGAWGHAHDRDWHPEIRMWMQAISHPWRTAIASQFKRGPLSRPLRPTRIPERVAELLAKSSVEESRS
jgi:hypothetical protein